jgi:hypothetical protein
MVQEYSKQVAQKQGKTEFKASNGWLESFRKRHQRVFNELCGESSDVNSENVTVTVTVTRCFEKAGFFTGEVTASVENENDQQDLQNCMNEAAFSNCNAEDYINIDKDVQTEPDTMDIDALVQNFIESKKKRGEEVEQEEDENDIVLEEEKCSMKTYQDAVKSLKELQEFAVQQNDSDMLGVISQAKVFVESQAAKRVNCMQKTLLDYWKK